MQEYLKKITLPQPGGSPQELRVLTPAEVETRLNERTLTPAQVDAKIDAKVLTPAKIEALIARSYFKNQRQYWENSTETEINDLLDLLEADGLGLADVWASMAWPTECMKYIDRETGELRSCPVPMPRFLPAFDLTGKTDAEIKAYFRYDLDEGGRRNVRVFGGLTGSLGDSPLKIGSLFAYGEELWSGHYHIQYYDLIQPMLIGRMDITLREGESASDIKGLFANIREIRDVTYRLAGGTVSQMFTLSSDRREVMGLKIYCRDGETASLYGGLMRNYNLNRAEVSIYGKCNLNSFFYECHSLRSVYFNKEMRPTGLSEFLPGSSNDLDVSEIDCSALTGTTQSISDTGRTARVSNLVLSNIGADSGFVSLSAHKVISWDWVSVRQTVRSLFNRIEAGYETASLTFNKNIRNQISDLIAEATAKGFTIIFK